MERALRPAGELPRVRRRLRRPHAVGPACWPRGRHTCVPLGDARADRDPERVRRRMGLFDGSGSLHTGADTYVAGFAVGGALGWLVATGVTAVVYTVGRQLVALAVPLVWFSAVVLAALGIAALIGPLPLLSPPATPVAGRASRAYARRFSWIAENPPSAFASSIPASLRDRHAGASSWSRGVRLSERFSWESRSPDPRLDRMSSPPRRPTLESD